MPGRPPPVHGRSHTPEWEAWWNAIRRTTDQRHPHWARYDGRGIMMASEWRNDFAAFLRHVGPRPEGTSLDRIDNAGDYAPGNVRWATSAEQGANKAARNQWMGAS